MYELKNVSNSVNMPILDHSQLSNHILDLIREKTPSNHEKYSEILQKTEPTNPRRKIKKLCEYEKEINQHAQSFFKERLKKLQENEENHKPNKSTDEDLKHENFIKLFSKFYGKNGTPTNKLSLLCSRQNGDLLFSDPGHKNSLFLQPHSSKASDSKVYEKRKTRGNNLEQNISFQKPRTRINFSFQRGSLPFSNNRQEEKRNISSKSVIKSKSNFRNVLNLYDKVINYEERESCLRKIILKPVKDESENLRIKIEKFFTASQNKRRIKLPNVYKESRRHKNLTIKRYSQNERKNYEINGINPMDSPKIIQGIQEKFMLHKSFEASKAKLLYQNIMKNHKENYGN